MTEFVEVAKVEDIPPGSRLHIDFEEESVIILNIEGKFYCIADLCSHDNGPLGDGDVDDHAIACPRHGACFDVRTGAALNLPATAPIPTYEVKIKDDSLWVESPDIW